MAFLKLFSGRIHSLKVFWKYILLSEKLLAASVAFCSFHGRLLVGEMYWKFEDEIFWKYILLSKCRLAVFVLSFFSRSAKGKISSLSSRFFNYKSLDGRAGFWNEWSLSPIEFPVLLSSITSSAIRELHSTYIYFRYVTRLHLYPVTFKLVF